MLHIKRINEDLSMGSIELDDASVIIYKSSHNDIKERERYEFSRFYDIITEPENPWEDKTYNPNNNVVTLTFEDGSNVSFRIEVNCEDMFDYLREVLD